MKEQTGDLQAIKEARFKEINAKLKHLPDLSINELKYLYNELHASKEDYIKYMAKLDIKEDKVSKISLFLVLILSVFLLGWMITQSAPLIVRLIELIFIFLIGVDCYREYVTKPRQKALDKYQNDVASINDLILKEEREEDRVIDVTLTKETQEQSVDLDRKNVIKPKYEYTLSSVFPTPEIEEIAMKVVRGENNEELEAEEQLTLKRELTKKDEEI